MLLIFLLIQHSTSQLNDYNMAKINALEVKCKGNVISVSSVSETVSSGSLFGPAVEGFAESFTEAPQKSSQAMRHLLPERTSSSVASSRPRPALTQQTAKPTPATPEPRPPEGWRDRGSSRSEQRYPFPKRQGSLPKIALDPVPQKSS